jgi:hypothetical protein
MGTQVTWAGAVADGPAATTEVNVVTSTGPWCQPADNCLGLAGWQGLADDPRLQLPLALAYTYNPDWRPLAKTAIQRGTSVCVAPLDADTVGEFTPADQRIRINQAVIDEDPRAVAAVLAHETYHAAMGSTFPNTREGSANCLGEEIIAHRWEASTFDRIPARGTPTPLSASEEQLVSLWRQQQLQAVVLLDPGYQVECLGGQPLPSPLPSTASASPAAAPTPTLAAPMLPNPIALQPGDARQLLGDWMWVCSGDVGIRLPGGTSMAFYDDDPTTGLVLLLPPGGGPLVLAPFGASCRPTGLPGLASALNETEAAMFTSGCDDGCQRVRLVMVDGSGTVVVDRWLP